MARGQLLRRTDLGQLQTIESPPAPEPDPEDELTERLETAWEGRLDAWWQQQYGGSMNSGRSRCRAKRRTTLPSTFSSLSYCSDLPSSPRSPDPEDSEARPLPPAIPTPLSQELSQESWVRDIPSERQQTLRNYMAQLPLHETTLAAAPSLSSQTQSLQATPNKTTAQRPSQGDPWNGTTMSRSQTSTVATPSRRQAPRKKARMGF